MNETTKPRFFERQVPMRTLLLIVLLLVAVIAGLAIKIADDSIEFNEHRDRFIRNLEITTRKVSESLAPIAAEPRDLENVDVHRAFQDAYEFTRYITSYQYAGHIVGGAIPLMAPRTAEYTYEKMLEICERGEYTPDDIAALERFEEAYRELNAVLADDPTDEELHSAMSRFESDASE